MLTFVLGLASLARLLGALFNGPIMRRAAAMR